MNEKAVKCHKQWRHQAGDLVNNRKDSGRSLISFPQINFTNNPLKIAPLE